MANNRLAAQWPLDDGTGSVARESRHMLDGILGARGGGPGPLWIPGQRSPGDPTDTSLRFGGDDFVAVEDVGCLEPQRLTVECCVRGEVHDDDPAINTAKPLAYIVSKGAASQANASYALYTGESSGLQFYVSDGVAQYVELTLPPSSAGGDPRMRVWDGAWHHVAGTYEPGSLKLYFDGIQVASGIGPTFIDYSFPTNDAFYIGNYDPVDYAQFGFIGDIDDVAVWARVLSPAEIMEHGCS